MQDSKDRYGGICEVQSYREKIVRLCGRCRILFLHPLLWFHCSYNEYFDEQVDFMLCDRASSLMMEEL